MEIRDAVAVVTGGASGIGRATVRELAGRGAQVVVADIHEDRLEEVRVEIEESGGRVLTVRCDVAYDDQVEHLRHEALEEMGRVDIVMNNAGVVAMGPPERMTMEEWDWILQVNVYGVIRGVRAFLPHMLERGSGHIVNTASLAGLFAYAWDSVPYITGKFAVAGFTEALALYARPLGVGVTLVCPGLVDTNLGETARFVGVDDPSTWIKEIQLPAAVAPEEVATRVVDAVAEDRFLVTTAEDHVKERVTQRAADHDRFVADMIGRLPTPPNLHRP
ncbi:MAG: SDR family oxidoreductase [Actinobacteria bacterium]|nr:SDR family oxidoreductase [Actinomycetota bacterium]